MLEETIKAIVKEAIRESIQEEIKKRITYKEQNNCDEVMTTKQLAAYLQCSVPWLTKNIKELNIPFKKIFKEYRFLKSDVIEWIKEQEQDTKNRYKRTVILNTNNKNDLK